MENKELLTFSAWAAKELQVREPITSPFAHFPMDLIKFQQNIESITDRNLASGDNVSLQRYL
jgi:hypothetical protein